MIIFALTVPQAKAGITINPSSINIAGLTNIPSAFTLNLTNNYNYTVFDIKLSGSDKLTTTTINILQANESKLVMGTFKNNLSENLDGSLTLSFNKLTLTDTTPTANTILITPSQYNPLFLNISKGSTVTWNNTHDIFHSATSNNGLFDYQLAPNTTATHTFNTIGVFSYHDTFMGFYGSIQVFNQSFLTKIHEPSLDQQITYHLVTVENPTVIESSFISTKEFTIPFKTQSEGLVKIKNVGNVSAIEVKLSVNAKTDWITFSKNAFQIDAGQESYIPFTIKPAIASSSETNKTYNFTMTIQGGNFELQTMPFSVSIPYEMFVFTTQTSTDELLDLLLKASELARMYNMTLQNLSMESCEQVTDILVNFSQEDVLALKTDTSKMFTVIHGLASKFDNVMLKVDRLQALSENNNASISMVGVQGGENAEKLDTMSVFWWALLTLIVLAVVLSASFFMIRKISKKKEIFKRRSGVIE